jgi:hypothetical protein
MSRQVVFYMISGKIHYVRDLGETERSNMITALGEVINPFLFITVNEDGVRHGRLLNKTQIESVDL